MAVFLTDGNERSTLAAVRALGRAGVAVYVGEATPMSLAGRSRFCAGHVTYPSPVTAPSEFRSFVAEHAVAGRYEMLLPMRDITVQLVADIRDQLPAGMAVPMPRAEQIHASQDKLALLSLAEEVGLQTPQTYLRMAGESLELFAGRLRYPVIVKPRFSKQRRHGRWWSGTAQPAQDREQFIRAYNACERVVPDPIVQERISGSGTGVFLLVWGGKLMAAFCHRRLREKPPSGGISVLCESVAPQQELIERSFRLLQKLGWQGVAMVEFKVDARDQQPKIMEVNARFWGSLQLAIDAGVNFPLLLYKVATGQHVDPLSDYRVGMRSRWLLGDLDHLIIRLAARRGSIENGPSKLRACANFLGWHRNTRQEMFRLDDPNPAWYELKRYLAEITSSAEDKSIAR
jgi:predicted ATP-grasp superfamily ATP-dependent carboligase